MPLESTYDHLEFLINQISQWEKDEIVYPIAKENLSLSASNHVNGLRIIKNLIAKTITKPASDLQKQLEKAGVNIDTETLIRKNYSKQVVTYYRMAERFNESFNNQKVPLLPYEIYHWISSILKDANVSVPIVVEASNQFVNQSFKETIIEPLQPSLELGENVLVPGSLKTISTNDIFEGYKINDGYIISYIRGEFKNILLWPILVHEVFHIVDREKKLVESFLAQNKGLPALSDDHQQNLKWITEIFMDVFSAKYFGPMYLLSLQTYFDRLPYVGQTLDHPEMVLRLRAIQLYVNEQDIAYTDIFDKCKAACIKMTSDKIEASIKAESDFKQKEEKIKILYKAITDFYDKLGFPSFRLALKHYQLQANTKETEMNFTDPFFDFEDITRFILEDSVSLAINPVILINIVMAQSDNPKYFIPNDRFISQVRFEVITDSITKWKILMEWRKATAS